MPTHFTQVHKWYVLHTMSQMHLCRYLGDVTGSQGNFFTGGWTSNSNPETGARNDLKKIKHGKWGNVVVLLTQRQDKREALTVEVAQVNKPTLH